MAGRILLFQLLCPVVLQAVWTQRSRTRFWLYWFSGSIGWILSNNWLDWIPVAIISDLVGLLHPVDHNCWWRSVKTIVLINFLVLLNYYRLRILSLNIRYALSTDWVAYRRERWDSPTLWIKLFLIELYKFGLRAHVIILWRYIPMHFSFFRVNIF